MSADAHRICGACQAWVLLEEPRDAQTLMKMSLENIHRLVANAVSERGRF